MNNLLKQDSQTKLGNMQNHNALTLDGKAGPKGKSFAQELNEIAAGTGKEHENISKMLQGRFGKEEIVEAVKDFKTKNQRTNLTKSDEIEIAKLLETQAQTELNQVRQEDAKREMQKHMLSESQVEEAHSHELQSAAHEEQIADASQANQKQIEEALKEGNVAEQNQEQQAEEEQDHVANWDNMAPTITEDSKNLAVKLDLPGVKDLETIIVKMVKGKVTVQALGDKKTMDQLQAQKSLLAKQLSDQNIVLGDLKAYDIKVLKNHQKRTKAS